jgi:hypothetical protein
LYPLFSISTPACKKASSNVSNGLFHILHHHGLQK